MQDRLYWLRITIVIAGAVLPAQAAAEFVFNRFDVPGAQSTVASGVNDSAVIVGSYLDNSGRFHGFIKTAGAFSTIDFPSAAFTSLTAINNSGTVAGIFQRTGSNYGDIWPFIYSNGTFQEIPEAPGSLHGSTIPRGINDAGKIVGEYVDPCFCNIHGFVYDSGTYTTIDIPSFSSSSVSAINNSGQLAVLATNCWGCGGDHGFVISGGTRTPTDYPAPNSATLLTGINDVGQVSGWFGTGGATTDGFVMKNGVFTLLDYPGSPANFLGAINNAGQVTGSYRDDLNSPNHGFLASPSPSYSVCLLYDPSKPAKSGSTLPIKVEVCDSSGANLSSPSLLIHVTGVTRVSDNVAGDAFDSGNANPDQDFRFDASLGNGGGYIYNLSTKGLVSGAYTLDFTIGAGKAIFHTAFQVR
jgi:hypothetical protein